MEPPKKETTYIAEFCDECYTTNLYTKKNHIQAKKEKKNDLPFTMAAKLPVLLCVISILTKIWKITFPKEFFN